MKNEQYPKIYLYRRVVRAKLYIDKCYSEKIDLDNISDEAYFSKFHFVRLFKSAYGKTPHQYLKYLRIEKAKQLLNQGTSVTETCYAIGFESVSSFSGLFSKMVGSSPSDYLVKQKAIKEQISKRPFDFIPRCYALQHVWIENSNFEEASV